MGRSDLLVPSMPDQAKKDTRGSHPEAGVGGANTADAVPQATGEYNTEVLGLPDQIKALVICSASRDA